MNTPSTRSMNAALRAGKPVYWHRAPGGPAGTMPTGVYRISAVRYWRGGQCFHVTVVGDYMEWRTVGPDDALSFHEAQ